MVTLKQRITKSSTKEVNPGTITDTLSWYKISPLNGYNLIRVKTKFARDGRESTKVSRAVTEAKSCVYEQIDWNLANPVKNDHGIIERLRIIAQKQTELQNELYDE